MSVRLLSAAEFSARTVDGLNRPLPGVLVRISCIISPPDDRQLREATILRLRSDRNGIVRGSYDFPSISCEQSRGVSVEKEGYGSFETGIRSKYMLERIFRADEVHRVARMAGDGQRRALRELLAGDFSVDRARFRDLVLYYEVELRPALRDLTSDSFISVRARELLSLLSVPDDLQLIVRPMPPSGDVKGPLQERWRYGVAAALLSPEGEDEWSFLRRCALNEFDDRWVATGAIQTLKLIASQRSRVILEEVATQSGPRFGAVAEALEYIKSNSGVPSGPELEALAVQVAQAVKVGAWKGNGPPRSSKAGDKAFVDLKFHSGLDRLTYTATFRRLGNVWILRGVRETLQQFGP